MKLQKTNYAEFSAISNFSFLRGASHPEEIVARAKDLGLSGIGIVDQHSLAGVVRAHQAAKHVDLPFRVGSKIFLYPEIVREEQHLECSFAAKPKATLLVYPISRGGYGNLCKLLTIGKNRASKGECFLFVSDFLKLHQDLAVIFTPSGEESAESKDHDYNTLEKFCSYDKLKNLSYLGLTLSYNNNQEFSVKNSLSLSKSFQLPLIAVQDVYYHIEERKPLQDILTCINEKCTIQEAGFRLTQNSDRYLKSLEQISHIYRDHLGAVRHSLDFLQLTAGFSLNELKYEYPESVCPAEVSPTAYLRQLVCKLALERYPNGVPKKVQNTIEEELKLIAELHYEKYFLTCYDLVRFANSKNILCQGRGAAANSAVCYCLGITSVDPASSDLLFARFISKERNEPPDIDIDFEHERREEVIQYLYRKYGRNFAGLTCAVITYRQRSAIRDVGKALGLSLAAVDRLAKSIHRWTRHELDLAGQGLEINDPTIQNCLVLSDQLLGFPRHLSQHVGGFVISQYPLDETVPIGKSGMESRSIIEWDKDDIEALGMLKIDVLALGMLTAIRKALSLISDTPQTHRSCKHSDCLALYSIPREDSRVYDMICAADTVGVFQIESRAQMSMLPRLKPRCFYDLVIEVAIVRPGPIQGKMVHPYLRRRNGLESVHYPDARVEKILGRTLGVPLFQEQAMRLAIELAGFSPGEAELLRRAIAAWKRDKGIIAKFKERIVAGMKQHGYSEEFAEVCMTQIKGFSEYGFPESHAASFANLVYASSWIKKFYPAHFAASILNSQPMGFYAPSQIIRDAVSHGVLVKNIDLNFSDWDCTIEYEATPAVLRLGMRQIKGISQEQVNLIIECRKNGGRFSSISSLWQRCHSAPNRLRKSTLMRLAEADAFRSLQLTRREALWNIHALPVEPLPLDRLYGESALPVSLPHASKQQEMFSDYETTGLSLRAHPLELVRQQLSARGAITIASLAGVRPRRSASIAGMGIVKQRPGTAKGMLFITLEDETGLANLLVRPPIFEQFKAIILNHTCILATGIVERVEGVIYINVNKLEEIDQLVFLESDVKVEVLSYSY